jgi:hypothetical protein
VWCAVANAACGGERTILGIDIIGPLVLVGRCGHNVTLQVDLGRGGGLRLVGRVGTAHLKQRSPMVMM